MADSQSLERGMNTITKRFRHSQYVDTFTLQFRQQPEGHYKIVALDRPHNSFERAAHRCHLDANGEVDVGKEPFTLDGAVAIAMLWMDAYSHYIRTGSFTCRHATRRQ